MLRADLFGFRKHRQQQRRQNGDDGDDDQQFEKREGRPVNFVTRFVLRMAAMQ